MSEDLEEVQFSEGFKRRVSLYSGALLFGETAKISQKSDTDPEDDERGINTSGWGILPDLVIEKVFSYLSIPQRYSASMVCQQWQRGFYLQGTWNTFELEDHTLTRHKFNYYMGWQLMLDHLRAQVCIFRIGRFIRNLVFSPMSNLFNLYEFMNMLSYYSERFEEDQKKGSLLRIRSFRFYFRCDMVPNEEQSVYGTGGKLLEALQRLMTNFTQLLNLELIDLMLDSTSEAMHLLDDVCVSLCETLARLVLINTTKAPLGLLHPACFVNLRVLKISPQNISTEVVELLCNNMKLGEVHLIQNKYTETAIAVDPQAWKEAKFVVFLRTTTKIDKEIIWQRAAPVTSVIYDCPLTKVTWTSILTTIELYSNKLEEFGHLSLPRFWRSKKFEDRCDSMLLTICRKCLYLNTIYIRERVSTSTILLTAAMSSNLRNFYVRRNSLILKCDYRNHNLDLDDNFVQWIQINSKSYKKMAIEVGQRLGQPGWEPLSDEKFKEITRLKAAY